MDIQRIRQNYAERSAEGLQELLDDLSSLREDAIHALKDELIYRNNEEGVQRINEFLAASEEEFTTEDAKEYIRKELSNGQSIDVIRLELIERGINIFDIINKDENLETEAMLHLTSLKESGVSDDEAKEQLNEKFVVVEGKEEELMRNVKRKGTINIVLGVFFLLMGIVLFFGQLYLQRLPITSLLFILIGLWRISRGVKYRK